MAKLLEKGNSLLPTNKKAKILQCLPESKFSYMHVYMRRGKVHELIKILNTSTGYTEKYFKNTQNSIGAFLVSTRFYGNIARGKT